MRNKVKMSLTHHKHFLLGTCALGIFIDIFLFGFKADLVVLFLTVLWILSVYLYEFEGRVSLIGGLAFLTICPFLLIFNKKLVAEKVVLWAYIFLAVGIVRLFVEYKKRGEKG